MKTNLLTILFLAGVTLFLANCSSNSGSSSVNGSCSSGQVYTQMGCLSTNTSMCGSTSYGYWSGGNYNGTYYNAGCYPATATSTYGSCSSGYVYTQMGCLVQNTAQCGSSSYGYWSGGSYNGTYYNAGCYPATSGTTTGLTCNSTDYVQTSMGYLQQGSCSTYCSQYGKRYGYYQGYCYPALY